MGFLACFTTVLLLSSAHGAKVAQDECSSKDAIPERVASLLQNLQPKPEKRDAMVSEADKLFDQLDVDNDGQLSKEEFQRYEKFEAVTDSPAASTAAPAAATTAGSEATMAAATGATMGSEPTMSPGAATTAMSAGAATAAPSATMAPVAASTVAANKASTMAADAAATMAADGATTAVVGDATTMMSVDMTTAAAMATDAVTMMPDAATTEMQPAATEAATAAPATAATAATAAPMKPLVMSKVAVVGTSECCGGVLDEVKTGGEGMKLTSVSGKLPEGLRYEEVFPGVDLVVMAADAYVGAGALNGIEQGLGAISLKGSSNTTFKFRFYKTGTETHVSVDELYFSFVDLDKSQDLTEQVEMLTGSDHVYIDQTSSVKWMRRDGGNASQFTGTILAPGGMPINDMKKSISWRFMHVAEVALKLTASGGNPAEARVFYFTGKTKLTKDACIKETPIPSDISLTKVGYSNLAGRGPSVLSPHGMLFKGIMNKSDSKAELGYRSIDLMVMNTEGKYEPQNSDQNGHNGVFGSINFEGGRKSNFSFTFMASGEVEPMEDFVLTILDVAKTPTGCSASGVTDKIEIRGISKAYLSDNSKFHMEEMGGGYYGFTGRFLDDKYAAVELPSNPFHLTPEQQSRSFAVQFSSASVIDITFDMTSLPAGTGRTIYFAGHSRLSSGGEVPFVCLKSLK
mmetsp:Transcript_41855/g.76020  ORF Transcript_41855/g.76020 Transcript_41855/m.76020 type:complete len:688 (+) Transcript_41855:60-2123(+)